MGELGDLTKTIVMCNRRCVMERHCDHVRTRHGKHGGRVVDALQLTEANTVATPAARDNLFEINATGRHRTLRVQRKTECRRSAVHRNKVARLNHWAADYPHLQRAVSVFFSNLLHDDLAQVEAHRDARERIPTVGVTYTCQKPLSRLAVPRDSDWAGDRKRRTSVLSGGIRSVIHPWRSWSEDFCTFWVT